jgi:hypothetical protein
MIHDYPIGARTPVMRWRGVDLSAKTNGPPADRAEPT